MIIPCEWLAEAGVHDFRPPPNQLGFRCDAPHTLVQLAGIELPLRRSGFPLDANGFRYDRMVRLLAGIRGDAALPPICIEPADPGRVRSGVHRYHASLTLGFSHVPAEIVERLC